MKKLTLILFAIFAFISVDIIAQVATATAGNGAKSVYKNVGSADHLNTSSVFGSIGDWAVDLTTSEKTPAAAATAYTGPSHNGMGATGWGPLQLELIIEHQEMEPLLEDFIM